MLRQIVQLVLVLHLSENAFLVAELLQVLLLEVLLQLRLVIAPVVYVFFVILQRTVLLSLLVG